MMKINKLIWIVSAGIAILGLFFVFFRIVKVNRQYPQTIEKSIEKGSSYEIAPKVNMSVLDARWLDGEELQQEYEGIWYVDNPADYQAVEVTVNISNLSGANQKIELFRTYIESEKYDWNGCDADLFMAKNSLPLEVELQSGQEMKCVLPYTFLKENYKENDWAQLSEISYFLVRERYPQKTKWLIKADLSAYDG